MSQKEKFLGARRGAIDRVHLSGNPVVSQVFAAQPRQTLVLHDFMKRELY